MRTLLAALFISTLSFTGFTDSQVVYYPQSNPMNKDIQSFLSKYIKKNCPQAVKNGGLFVIDTKVAYDEIDQGIVDTYYTVTIEAEDWGTNDDDSEEITVVIEDADLTNSERLSVISLEATGNVCK